MLYYLVNCLYNCCILEVNIKMTYFYSRVSVYVFPRIEGQFFLVITRMSHRPQVPSMTLAFQCSLVPFNCVALSLLRIHWTKIQRLIVTYNLVLPSCLDLKLGFINNCSGAWASKVTHVCLSIASLIPRLFEDINANLIVNSMENAVCTEE